MSDTTTNQVEIVLIRHGKTEGNKEKRYIGRTDQPLSEEGIAGIKENLGRYPSVEKGLCQPNEAHQTDRRTDLSGTGIGTR